MPMRPPAPSRFSTTTGCPSASPRRALNMRLMVSTELPGAFGTSMRTGRLGYSCANVAEANASSKPNKSLMTKIIDAPPWLVSLMTPLIARLIVRQLVKEHPDWGPEQIAAKLRADLGHEPGPAEIKLLAEVLRRWPGTQPASGPFSPSAFVLVTANLVALYGIFAFGWDVFPLVLLYW